MSDQYLSQDEVDALPEGVTVEVTWSGGNGPHRYKVEVGPGGERYAGILRYDNPLTFVGKERYHTRVRLVSEHDLAQHNGIREEG